MRRLASILILVLLTSMLPAMQASAKGLTVEVKGRYQSPGGVVSIYGSANPGANVSIVVTSPLGDVILNTTVKTDEGGNYSLELTLQANATPGIYEISAYSEGESAEENFTVTISSLETIAERLIWMSNMSRMRVETLMERLNNSGVEIPEEAVERYENGLEALSNASMALRGDEPDKAIEHAMEALKDFRIALRILSEEAPRTTAEDLAEKMRILETAIDRAYSFLDRVEELADSLEGEGYDVSEARSLLEEANTHLGNAEEFLSHGEVNDTARELASARGLMGRAWGYLHMLMADVRERRVEIFLNHTEKRIEILKARVEALRGRVPDEKLDRCLERLDRVEERLEGIREHLREREMGAVVEELDNASRNMGKALEEVEGDYSRLLREMDRLQAKMLMLNITAKAIAIRGGNATDIKEKIKELKMEMKDMMEHFEERRVKGREIKKWAEKQGVKEHQKEMMRYLRKLREKYMKREMEREGKRREGR